MKNERLEALVQRGRDTVHFVKASRSKELQDSIESIIREAWLMGKSEYVDRPPFVEHTHKSNTVEVETLDEITDEGDLP